MDVKGGETVKKERQLLVYFDTKSGEYESCDHVVVSMKNGESAEECVHNYFMEYYPGDEPDEIDRAKHYEWMYVPAVVTDISWRIITKKQFDMLQELGLLWR